jgi:hypothetical protein
VGLGSPDVPRCREVEIAQTKSVDRPVILYQTETEESRSSFNIVGSGAESTSIHSAIARAQAG